ncbi:hypothetical protein FAIPA1_580013 [Frankia sp. AiPs1]
MMSSACGLNHAGRRSPFSGTPPGQEFLLESSHSWWIEVPSRIQNPLDDDTPHSVSFSMFKHVGLMGLGEFAWDP